MQVLSASSFLVLFLWWMDQGNISRRTRHFPEDQGFLIIISAMSITFCTILSTTLFDVVYLNLAILPACIGILYGNFRSGLCLAAFFILCTALYSSQLGVSSLVINTGVLLYPLLFGLAGPFKSGKLIEKIGMLWIVLFPSMLFIVLVPRMYSRNIYDTNPSNAVLAAVYLFVTVILGALFVYCIETAWDRLQIKEQMKGISEKFKWESEKLQQITDVVELNIMSLNDSGYITELNEFMMKLVHRHHPELSREIILSQPAAQIFKGNMDEKTFDSLRNIIGNKQRSNAKIKLDDSTYQIYIAPLEQGAGAPGGTVVIVEDLTQEENLRHELDNVERLTLVGQMAAGITHEIRNPMAVVRGFLQLMREKSPDELNSYYQIVMDELDRANSIINDFLSLAQSRISDTEQVHLHHVIEELSPLIWADANLRGQSVELKLSPSLPLLQLNVREIKQLILNLARNGMEAMDSKGVLTVETRINGDRVDLMIRDTGGGIPQNQIDNLFVPFFTTKSQGTGLGLPLCLSIVERHKGVISVDSVEGSGTVFTVSFPVERDDQVQGKGLENPVQGMKV